MRNMMSQSYEAKKLLSEVGLLRKLSGYSDNCFVPKIVDIIVSAEVKDPTDEPLDFVFIVMEHVD